MPFDSQAKLDDSAALTPVFIADAYGEYILKLEVMDDFGAISEADFVTVSFTNFVQLR